jgi:hypothetical protein
MISGLPLHVFLSVCGLALVTTTSMAASFFSPLGIPFALWSALPYGVLWLAGRQMACPWIIGGAGVAALAAETAVRLSVFVWPRGSTAAIVLLFSPVYIVLFVMPLGAAAGWLYGRLWRAHPLGRAIVLMTAPVALGLMVIGLARPEFLPWTMAERRDALERIGPPRVVAGANEFESVTVSARPAWAVVAELDGPPGAELVIADNAAADIRDSTTLESKGRVDLGARVWGSFSTLVRLPDGRVVVADTGGGFSRTLLKDPAGATLWEYRPDPAVSPAAMRPADLEGDGLVEFYAASTHTVARLDTRGREVWRRPSTLASILALLPQHDGLPGWVVGLEYGRKRSVWDADGRLLSERSVTETDSPMTAVDVFDRRVLIHGGRSARGYTLDGARAFEVPLGDFTLSGAAGVRLSAAEPPALALTAATDQFTNRSRLLLVGAGARTIYDEILADHPLLLIAPRADGTDALFIRDAKGLRLLRPKVSIRLTVPPPHA